jgi:hypothetical protein
MSTPSNQNLQSGSFITDNDADATADGTNITTFINITYADYNRIKDVEDLGNINIVQQPGKDVNRFTLTESITNKKIIEDKDVLVVIEHNNRIYDVTDKTYVIRDGDTHAANLRTDVIVALSGTRPGSASSIDSSVASSSNTEIQSRPGSAASSSNTEIQSRPNTALNKNNSSPPDLPKSYDKNNKELKITDKVKVTGRVNHYDININNEATIQNILDKNRVSIRRKDAGHNRLVPARSLSYIRKFSGGGKETRRKQKTKSNNNKTRSNHNKNM